MRAAHLRQIAPGFALALIETPTLADPPASSKPASARQRLVMPAVMRARPKPNANRCTQPPCGGSSAPASSTPPAKPHG
jgi:hypothetical protein